MVHVLANALGMSRDLYLDCLASYGVKSSTELSERKAKQLLDDLEIKAKAAGVWQTRRRDFKPKSADAMTRKVRALWAELHQAGRVEANTDQALAAYVKRMTGRDSIRWCSVAQKTTLIEALKKWLAR